MQNAGKSKHLRELGRSLTEIGIMNYSNLKFDVSSIDYKNNASFDETIK